MTARFALLSLALAWGATPALAVGPKQVEFDSKDGLKLTADLYAAKSKSAPVLVLCHQARSSRGEYREIAPKLQAAGYTCLALDQRSGKTWKGVDNETAKRAAAAKKATGYRDAKQDIEAGIDWIKAQGHTGKLALWGSSYSSSLVLVIAAEREDVAAVLSFSPGEYFKHKADYVRAAAKTIAKRPVLIVAPERERKGAAAIHAALPKRANARLVIDAKIRHGSRTLVGNAHAATLWKDTVLPFVVEALGKPQ